MSHLATLMHPYSRRTFVIMLLIACIVHVAALLIFRMIPTPQTKDIPVRSLSFYLGESEPAHRVAARVMTVPAVPTKRTVETPRARMTMPPATLPKPSPELAPKPVATAKSPAKPLATKTVTTPVATSNARIDPSLLVPPIHRQVPQENSAFTELPRSVRESGLPSIDKLFSSGDASVGTLTGITPAAGGSAGIAAEQQAIKLRYEQQISAWIARNKFYPKAAGTRTGKLIMRVRIDRQGNVKYYAIEQTSGYQAFDAAGVEMVRRANPMPAVPAQYPGGDLVEFLIPMTFEP